MQRRPKGRRVTESITDAQGAVFSCKHVLRQNAPLLSVGRSIPIDSDDSGWFAHCGAQSHDNQDIMIVSAETLANRCNVSDIPSLKVGAWCWRHSPSEEWTVGTRGLAAHAILQIHRGLAVHGQKRKRRAPCRSVRSPPDNSVPQRFHAEEKTMPNTFCSSTTEARPLHGDL
jgi:hypothetical protein